MGPSGGAPTVWHKLVAGVTSGALASGLCNPTDVVKVRMQADRGGGGGGKAVPRYPNVFSAFYSIGRSEGLRGLYRGVAPTMQRAAVIAGVELASYDEAKVCACVWVGVGGGGHMNVNVSLPHHSAPAAVAAANSAARAGALRGPLRVVPSHALLGLPPRRLPRDAGILAI
jgi:hypothetical protein